VKIMAALDAAYHRASKWDRLEHARLFQCEHDPEEGGKAGLWRNFEQG